LSEWLAYFELEPFGEDQDEWRAGMIASTTANLFSKKQYKPQDFMRKQYQAEKPEPTMEQVVNKMDLIFGAMSGGKRKKR